MLVSYFWGEIFLKQYAENIIHLTEYWMGDKSKKKGQHLWSWLELNNAYNFYFIIVSSTEFTAIYFWIGFLSVRFIKSPQSVLSGKAELCMQIYTPDVHLAKQCCGLTEPRKHVAFSSLRPLA